jgi:REP element-mobilizing transposase RayT/DNA-binding NarL/FixJ family response regulator
MPPLRKRVFILTPSSGFGDLIRQVLEDTGRYQPFLFSNPKDAVEAARKDAVALLILDAALGPQTPPVLIAELRQHAPHSRLLVIPTQENPHDPELKLLAADAILPSPFYLPDLVAAIEQFFGPLVPSDFPRGIRYEDKAAQVPVPTRGKTSPPLWIEVVSQAATYLAKLSLESASRAALITKGHKVWAYAGELPPEAADELAAVVAEHANEADLARFIHLNATGVDYMLYATSLGGNFTLALTFDAQMSFSQMRTRVNELAQALATAPQQVLSEKQPVGRSVERRAYVYSQAGESEPPSPPERGAQAQAPSQMPSTPQRAASPEAPAVASPGLKYSFVMIPRLPKHRLKGDLAEKLAVWLPELCLAFAWNIERISIQLDSLQWTISISPDSAPESAAELLDKHLSAYIFEDFPRLARDNPSGHFWAAGYLIVNGAQPSPEHISEYMQQTRARQGVPR